MSFFLPNLALADPDRDLALCGPLDDLAAGFGATLAQLHISLGGDPDYAPRIASVAAAVSLAVSEGHACLPLHALRDTAEDSTASVVKLALATSPVVLSDPAIGLDTPREALIIDRGRLYLQRYWRYETRLARLIAAIDQALPIATDEAVDLALDGVFDAGTLETDWQRVAARTALTRRLAVITGGPGTGKTRTVARLLAALTKITPTARIALAAPTGKAALRLEQSVKEQIAMLGIGGERAALSGIKALTVHSLLGARYGGVSFKHDKRRPLPHDVVVIDEASMLDLALATKLMDALPVHARLVLLGDADQLASVETGAVFAEISSLGRLGADGLQGASAVRPLADAVVELKVSYRYQSGGAIGRFADAVRTGDVPLAVSLLDADVTTLSLGSTEGARSGLIEHLLAGFDPFLAAIQASLNPIAVLQAFARYRVLCALRQGPFGSLSINAALERGVARRLGVLDGVAWFAGRPVIVTQNDPLLKLFNGDVGVALLGADQQLMVYFEDAGEVRAIAPGRLPNCETALALTIHKSQGSEFERIDIILPPEESPLAARELIYTAVTRARESVRLWGDEQALVSAIGRPTLRYSALGERLLS